MKELFPMYGLSEPLFPMNAKKYGEKPTTTLEALLDNDNYWAEIKWDGARATTAEGRFFSRHASEDKSNPSTIGFPVENTDRIPHLSALFEQLPGVWLDGEIIYKKDGVMNSDAVTSIMGCTPEKAISRQRENGYVSYMIFDLLYYSYSSFLSASFETRRTWLEAFFREHVNFFQNFGQKFNCEITLSQVARNRDEKEELLKYVKDNGLEGLMFKHRLMNYRPNKRPEGYWYKVKKGLEADVVIMGFTEGKGKFSGLVGSIEFGQWKKADKHPGNNAQVAVMPDGFYVLTKCGSCSGMDDDFRTELTLMQENYLGRVITITAMERTKAGQFRHPQFSKLRPEKPTQECIWGEN